MASSAPTEATSTQQAGAAAALQAAAALPASGVPMPGDIATALETLRGAILAHERARIVAAARAEGELRYAAAEDEEQMTVLEGQQKKIAEQAAALQAERKERLRLQMVVAAQNTELDALRPKVKVEKAESSSLTAAVLAVTAAAPPTTPRLKAPSQDGVVEKKRKRAAEAAAYTGTPAPQKGAKKDAGDSPPPGL